MELSCAKCGSKKIVADAAIVDQGRASDGQLKAVIFTKPQARLFKGRVYGHLYARICGDCGYTEIYTENAGRMFAAFVRSQQAE